MMRQRRDWTADTLNAVPGAWRQRVKGIHAGKMLAAEKIPSGTGRKSDAEREANLWLAGVADRMHAIRVPLNLSDSELCQMAKDCAAACMDIAFKPGTVTDTGTLRRNMAGVCQRYGLEAPPVTVTDTGAIKRMGDDIWWRRRLRVAQGRAIEREAIALGYVHRNREIYASTVTVERRAQQKRRNALALERTVAVNQFGDEFTLAELAERAVSNPRIRRGELMTRISGFESVARSIGHVGMFFTQTCPSRMHPKKSIAGKVFDNPKFDGTTPKEAQRYLVTVWAKVRAALARAGAAVYGFRIAEPHHDAAPHWHLLLFMAAEVKDTVCSIFAKYARKEDAEELTSKEARKARFLAKEIDWSRGTAAGYIAKYVSKNIDGGGYQVQGDIEGGAHEAVTPSHRVEAWAAAWGIRQFQQIGGAPVGVWRELRRLKEADTLTDTVRAAQSAADVGNWHRYTEVMGGACRKRVERPISVAYTRPGERYNADKGETMPAPLNKYGEQAPGAIFGVLDTVAARSFVTRVYQWEVRHAEKAGFLDKCGETKGVQGQIEGGDFVHGKAGRKYRNEEKADRRTGSNGNVTQANKGCTSGKRNGVFDFAGESRPWTRVNNCTEGVDYDFSGEGVSVAREGESRALCIKFGADPTASKGLDAGNAGDSGGTGERRRRPSGES